jgi:alcohol dehydrogenase
MNAAAAVLTGPQQIEVTEFPLPQIGTDDAILAVEACGLCGSDWDQWTNEENYSDGFPIIPGHEPFGRIHAIGENARKRWGVDVGDRVIVESVLPCGICSWCRTGHYFRCTTLGSYGLYTKSTVEPYLWGGYATHMYVDPRSIVHKIPEHVPTGTMALWNPLSNAVRWVNEVGGAALGTTVLICGPGQRGLLGVFVARTAGASQIIVSGTKADKRRLQMARELGATTTINVDEEDVVARVKELTGGMGVDSVVDVSAHSVAPIAQGVEAVKRGGRIVIAGVKGDRPLEGVYSDRIFWKEIQIVGVLSSAWGSVEKSIALLSAHHQELSKLVTHSYKLSEAATALQVLGRKIIDGPELLNVHVRGEV